MKVALIRLSKSELWELICNFEASFDAAMPENVLAKRVLDKLTDAYEKVRK